jgi:hypothetical protein
MVAIRHPITVLRSGLRPSRRRLAGYAQIRVTPASPRRDIHRTWKRLIPTMLNLLQRKQESQEKVAA